jgi:hypothetical protein
MQRALPLLSAKYMTRHVVRFAKRNERKTHLRYLCDFARNEVLSQHSPKLRMGKAEVDVVLQFQT